jgi:hypothetical protein
MSATETTPLLSTGAGDLSTQQQSAEDTAPLLSSDAENAEPSISNPRIVKTIKVLTYISLIGSSICLVLLVATSIVYQLAPLRGYYYIDREVYMTSLGIAVGLPPFSRY